MKYLFMVSALLLIACSPQNERYYQTHPQALQKALKDCPSKTPANLSCEQLKTMASTMNDLGLQLQTNPQLFGKKILALQELIAKQAADLKAKTNQPELKSALEKNEQLLEQYLVLVKWLESPVS